MKALKGDVVVGAGPGEGGSPSRTTFYHSYGPELLSFRLNVVRDLYWTFRCPHLLREDWTHLSILSDRTADAILGRESVREWLRRTDDDPSDLLEFLRTEPHHLRLGYYFSLLVEYWLTRCPVFGGCSDTPPSAREEDDNGGKEGQSGRHSRRSWSQCVARTNFRCRSATTTIANGCGSGSGPSSETTIDSMPRFIATVRCRGLFDDDGEVGGSTTSMIGPRDDGDEEESVLPFLHVEASVHCSVAPETKGFLLPLKYDTDANEAERQQTRLKRRQLVERQSLCSRYAGAFLYDSLAWRLLDYRNRLDLPVPVQRAVRELRKRRWEEEKLEKQGRARKYPEGKGIEQECSERLVVHEADCENVVHVDYNCSDKNREEGQTETSPAWHTAMLMKGWIFRPLVECQGELRRRGILVGDDDEEDNANDPTDPEGFELISPRAFDPLVSCWTKDPNDLRALSCEGIERMRAGGAPGTTTSTTENGSSSPSSSDSPPGISHWCLLMQKRFWLSPCVAERRRSNNDDADQKNDDDEAYCLIGEPSLALQDETVFSGIDAVLSAVSAFRSEKPRNPLFVAGFSPCRRRQCPSGIALAADKDADYNDVRLLETVRVVILPQKWDTQGRVEKRIPLLETRWLAGLQEHLGDLLLNPHREGDDDDGCGAPMEPVATVMERHRAALLEQQEVIEERMREYLFLPKPAMAPIAFLECFREESAAAWEERKERPQGESVVPSDADGDGRATAEKAAKDAFLADLLRGRVAGFVSAVRARRTRIAADRRAPVDDDDDGDGGGEGPPRRKRLKTSDGDGRPEGPNPDLNSPHGEKRKPEREERKSKKTKTKTTDIDARDLAEAITGAFAAAEHAGVIRGADLAVLIADFLETFDFGCGSHKKNNSARRALGHTLLDGFRRWADLRDRHPEWEPFLKKDANFLLHPTLGHIFDRMLGRGLRGCLRRLFVAAGGAVSDVGGGPRFSILSTLAVTAEEEIEETEHHCLKLLVKCARFAGNEIKFSQLVGGGNSSPMDLVAETEALVNAAMLCPDESSFDSSDSDGMVDFARLLVPEESARLKNFVKEALQSRRGEGKVKNEMSKGNTQKESNRKQANTLLRFTERRSGTGDDTAASSSSLEIEIHPVHDQSVLAREVCVRNPGADAALRLLGRVRPPPSDGEDAFFDLFREGDQVPDGAAVAAKKDDGDCLEKPTIVWASDESATTGGDLSLTGEQSDVQRCEAGGKARSYPVVGFDCEWYTPEKVKAKKTDAPPPCANNRDTSIEEDKDGNCMADNHLPDHASPLPVAIVQVAFADTNTIVLYDMHKGAHRDRLMHGVLSRCSLLGFGLKNDLQRLMQVYDRCSAPSSPEGVLKRMSAYDIRPSNRSQGLKQMARIHLGIGLNKSQQISNWARRPLSRAQVEYAACDAWILLPLLAAMAQP